MLDRGSRLRVASQVILVMSCAKLSLDLLLVWCLRILWDLFSALTVQAVLKPILSGELLMEAVDELLPLMDEVLQACEQHPLLLLFLLLVSD